MLLLAAAHLGFWGWGAFLAMLGETWVCLAPLPWRSGWP